MQKLLLRYSFKVNRLLFQGNLIYFKTIVRQFFLICEKRMINRHAANFFYLGKGQGKMIRAMLFYPVPERFVFTHFSSSPFGKDNSRAPF